MSATRSGRWMRSPTANSSSCDVTVTTPSEAIPRFAIVWRKTWRWRRRSLPGDGASLSTRPTSSSRRTCTRRCRSSSPVGERTSPAALGGSLGRAAYPFVLVAMPLIGLLPPIVLLASALGIVGTAWLLWATISIIVNVLFWAALYRYMGESVGYALLYPLGLVMLLAIALGGVRRGQRVEWKQRTYLSS